MKIFLTGGTGFIGSHFINLMRQSNPEESIRALRRPSSIQRMPLAREPEWVTGDLAGACNEWFEGCDALVHLAAAGVLPKDANWEDCFRVNVSESIRLWRIAAKTGVKRFLICGSCFEFGRTAESESFLNPRAFLEPTGSYHASKAAATMAAMGFAAETGLEVAVFRPFHIFGEGEDASRFWPSLRKAALEGADFPMTAGQQIRDFTPVKQAAQKFRDGLMRSDIRPGQVLLENIGTGHPLTLREFAEFWWKEWGATGVLQFGVVPYRAGEVMRYVPQL